MKFVKPKKFLGQHFLKDLSIASDIVDALTNHQAYKVLLELGPGMGVLTEFILKKKGPELFLVEIDRDSIPYLKEHFKELEAHIIEADFLRMDLKKIFPEPFGLIGNFPYNISSQIFFKVLEHKERIPEVVCMLQKEVAVRIQSGPGNKNYGILSVLLQAFYDIEYLFTVDEHVFNPPPKVKSGVIRLKRNQRETLPCDEKEFLKVVKQSFSTRRKTLRNCLKSFAMPETITQGEVFNKRAEQLSVEDFIDLTILVQNNRTHGV